MAHKKTFSIVYFTIIFMSLMMLKIEVLGQTSSKSFSPVEDLAGAGGSCTSPGTENLSWYRLTVSGVGTLNTTTNALTTVSFTVDNSCTGTTANMELLQLRVMAPDGTCAGVYYGTNGGAAPDATTSLNGTQKINLINAQACTNYPNTFNTGTSSNNYNEGFYGAKWGDGTTDTPTNLTTVFNGKNADGDWKFIFSEGTGSEPCLKAISLTFGDPDLITAEDKTATGNTCSTAIPFCGQSFCASTNGKTGEANSPGATSSSDVSMSTFNNGSCDWNADNNNDTWVKFIAASTNVSISISGLDMELQSIVVTNPFGNGGTCTANGEQWNVVSCPRDLIYTNTSGGRMQQTHTFNATIGNTYYLVIDGNNGQVSNFYVSLSGGSLDCQILLPIELSQFNALNHCDVNILKWTTESERNNNYFIIEETEDGVHFKEIAIVDGAGNSISENNYEIEIKINNDQENYFYRLTQVDFDGKKTSTDIITIKSACDEEKLFMDQNILYLKGVEKQNEITVIDLSGRIILKSFDIETLNISSLSSSFYYVVVNTSTSILKAKIFKP